MSTTLIHPDALLAQIEIPTDFEALDRGQRVLLPGAQEHSGDVTLRQYFTLARHAQETFDPTTRFVDAINKMRSQWLRGRQKDFGMVDHVMVDLRKRNVNSQLSDDQERLLITCLEALSGINRHWDAGIANRIDAVSRTIREDLQRSFMRVETQGQFQRVMGHFQSLFGRPARTAPGEFRDAVVGGLSDGDQPTPSLADVVPTGF